MKKKGGLALLSAVFLLAGTADAGFISILGEDGSVFNLDTTTGVASLAVKFPDPGGSSQEQYSPNGLVVSGGMYFFTNFNVTGPDTLYRNGTALTTIPAADPYNIANGDAAGNTFYFVDRHTGALVTIGNIFGAPGTQTISCVSFLSGMSAMGDLAISGTTGYLSYDAALLKFDMATLTYTQKALNRYVGLGFDGGTLYGVRRAGDNKFELYRIDTASLTQTKVANISGIPTTGGAVAGRYEITDAASAVPIPATAWLLGSGLIGLLGLRRKRA